MRVADVVALIKHIGSIPFQTGTKRRNPPSEGREALQRLQAGPPLPGAAGLRQADSRGELSPLRGTPAHDFCLPAPPRAGRAGPRRGLVSPSSPLAEFRQDFGGRPETTCGAWPVSPRICRRSTWTSQWTRSPRVIDAYLSRRRREGLSGSRSVSSPAWTSTLYWAALQLDHHHDCIYLVVGPDPCGILRTSYEHHRLQ